MPDIEDRIRRILPSHVGLGTGIAQSELWRGESLPGATPTRLREFALGRSAARAAMADVGMLACAVPMGADRAPIWPESMVGSISHCHGACFAVVGNSAEFQGLGLDIESRKPLAVDLWDIILRPEELAELHLVPPALRGQIALRYFVAKEAAYKAQYQQTRELFDFQTLRIVEGDGGFSAIFQYDIGHHSAGALIEGKLAQSENFVAAVSWIKK